MPISSLCDGQLRYLASVHQEATRLVQQSPRRPRLALSHCELDGIPLAEHPRCRLCRILVGPGHWRTELEDGLCDECRAYLRRRRAAR